MSQYYRQNPDEPIRHCWVTAAPEQELLAVMRNDENLCSQESNQHTMKTMKPLPVPEDVQYCFDRFRRIAELLWANAPQLALRAAENAMSELRERKLVE